MLFAARQTEADLVIIAGDLFDSQRVKDNLISFVVEGLKSLTAQVVILPGNHDCLTPMSAYSRSTIWEDCPNFRILGYLVKNGILSGQRQCGHWHFPGRS
jgi:DNA repair exonuclease SbcCD nuclease subunit